MPWLTFARVGSLLLLLVTACTSSTPPPNPTALPTAVPPTPIPAPPTLAPTPAPTVAPTAAPAPAKAVPAVAGGPAVGGGDVRKVAEAMAGATSFRMHIQSTANGQSFDGLVEIVRPDRQHFKMGGGGQTIETITIGPDSYTNLTGQWTKSTSNAAALPFLAQMNAETIVKGFDTGTQNGDTLTQGALDVVDGVPCQQWVLGAAAGSRQSGTMCIGLLDNLPRRYVSTDGTSTVTFSDWNAPLTINAPI